MAITGGTVVDGTGADRFTADIGIKDGKITETRARIDSLDQTMVHEIGIQDPLYRQALFYATHDCCR